MTEKKLLLHICCSPDSTVPWPALLDEGYNTVGFFYGSNIHPEKEFILRRDAVLKFADIIESDVVIAEYTPDKWIKATYEYKNEPERGLRCPVCFRLQLEACATYAVANGFNYITTTLTISPHKNPDLINSIGHDVAEKYKLTWIDRIWRKQNGFKKSVEACKKHGIYRQNYCGCVYSIRTEEDGVNNEAEEK